MKYRRFLYVVIAAVLLICTLALAENNSPVIREEQKIKINNVEETWRLEWTTSPDLACAPDDPNWMTCPCIGFAFGESGELMLIRKRAGQKDEKFLLTELFDGDDLPGSGAILQRWDVYKNDYKNSDSPDFKKKVYSRPSTRIMKFGDYDHDGQASEFVLQIGTLPCGKRMSVVVGVSRKNNKLHVFTTAEHPDKPLVLQAWHWEALKNSKGSINVTHWQCGDHGGETQEEIELYIDAKGIHETFFSYECNNKGQKGKLLSKEAIKQK